jgi:hypothetical protein
MSDAEGEGGGGFAEEGDGAPLGLVVLDGEVDGAGPAVDGDEEVALAALAVGGLQLRQVLDVDVDEAEVVVPELALAALRPVGRRRWPSAQPLGAQDAPDAVAVEVWEEVGDDEGEVVEGEVGGPTQGADNGSFLLGCPPGKRVRSGGVVKAVVWAAFAPLGVTTRKCAECPARANGRATQAAGSLSAS